MGAFAIIMIYFLNVICQTGNIFQEKTPKAFYWEFHMQSFGIIMTNQKEFNWCWNSNLEQVIFFFFLMEEKKRLYLI